MHCGCCAVVKLCTLLGVVVWWRPAAWHPVIDNVELIKRGLARHEVVQVEVLVAPLLRQGVVEPIVELERHEYVWETAWNYAPIETIVHVRWVVVRLH
jgi:hypothetical protein